MRKHFSLLLLFVFCCRMLPAQNSCALRISLLTCAPGGELYSTWGHTAIRVMDAGTGDDYVFNYGTFEFGPDFNRKFIKGNLLYSLSVDSFSYFMMEFKEAGRNVWEQELQVSCEEKEKIYKALQVNATGNNRYYVYNFLFDNCTTRARDIIVKNLNNAPVFESVLPTPTPTFRDLIHIYLDKEKEYWSKLGIDILLGDRLDEKPNNFQALFLPDYLLAGMQKAKAGKTILVAPASILLSVPPIRPSMPLLIRPMSVFTLLLLIICAATVLAKPALIRALVIFDFVFFMLLGLVGIMLLLMWFDTAHSECGNNFNLVWALPTHTVMAFFVHKSNSAVRKYFTGVFVITLVLLCAWLFLPQQMNAALIPLLLIVLLRSWKLSKQGYGRK